MNLEGDEKSLIARIEQNILSEIETLYPEIKAACDVAVSGKHVLVFHQDSFAFNYQEGEFTLLGKVIKYAGLRHVDVHVVGKNRETLKKSV